MKLKVALLAGVVLVVAAAGTVAACWQQAVPLAGMVINYVRSFTAPPGTLTNVATPATPPPAWAPAPPTPGAAVSPAADGNWAGYNKTLTSERYAGLDQINVRNAAGLRVLCTYDTGQHTSFQTGLLMVNGALIGTTEYDIFSLNPASCAQNWRTHEAYTPASYQGVNRGAAYMDGKLFRGTEDGRVLAYDFSTGKRLWAVSVADPKRGESTPSAPIAWQGLVFIGNAGGDVKGVKGRMYALDAATGKVVWEFYLVPRQAGDPVRGPQGASPLDTASWGNAATTPISGGATWTSYTLDPASGLIYVPGGNPSPDFAPGVRPGDDLYSGSMVVLDAKTGAYKNDFKLVQKDWHDWDVSTAPSLVHTKGGRYLMSAAPKDGFLYGYDLASNALLYRVAATRIENATTPFAVGQKTHFCPGSIGGAEWNGPAYDPQTNLVVIGEVDWCTTVTLQSEAGIEAVKAGTPWSANVYLNPYNTWGKQDPYGNWAGWVSGFDADSGALVWRDKSNYPVMSGMTPTAGGLVLFGDMGGNFYAVDAGTGAKIFGARIGGAIGGGVITYTADGLQKIAVATGMTSILWPTAVVTAKVVVLGLRQAQVDP